MVCICLTRFKVQSYTCWPHVFLCAICISEQTAITVFPYAEITGWFLGIFAKLQKAAISFIMSACPSVCMEQLGSHWMNFYEMWYLSTFWKSVKKIQVSLKVTRIMGVLHEYIYYIFIIILVLHRMKNVRGRSCKGNQNTHFMFSNFFLKVMLFMK